MRGRPTTTSRARTRPGVAPLNEPSLREDIAAARAVADHVIVAFSSGAEYVQTTIRQQDEAVRIALEAGATLVVGNHPHAVQPLVEQGGALVAFALGNFVFDQDWSIETTQSVLLEVGFSADRIIGYRVRPVVIRTQLSARLRRSGGHGGPRDPHPPLGRDGRLAGVARADPGTGQQTGRPATGTLRASPP